MEKKKNIVLCGFMATGKTSVGKKLAELLDREFVDLDAAIEAEEGVSIPQIFAGRGEPAFRELESRMVERIMNRSGLVISTGGGTIVNPRNLANLKSCGVVVALTADIPTILRRAGTGDSRPLLQTEDREERIRALLLERAPFYAQADITLDTSLLTIEEVSLQIYSQLSHEITFNVGASAVLCPGTTLTYS